MELITLLITTIIIMSIGIFIANIIIESNIIMPKLQFIIKPMCINSHLPKESIMSVITCFMSPLAGRVMLSEFYKDGKVSKLEVVLTTVMSTFVTVIGELLFRMHALSAIMLIGPILGGIYLLFGLFAAFIQSFSAFLIARYMLFSKKQEFVSIIDEKRKVSSQLIIKNAFKKATATIKKILPMIIAIFLFMHILINFGFMEYIQALFKPWLLHIGLPKESLTVFIAQSLHFSAGYTMVSVLLAQGAINSKQAIVSLLIGNMMVITILYIKFSFSTYISLFGKFGIKIAIINYMSNMIVKAAIILMIIIIA